MTRVYVLIALFVVFGLYVACVVTIGFPGATALGLHFIRVVATVAALIIYIRGIRYLFRDDPIPPRDWLLGGIIWILLGTVCFSFWNEVGRVFGIDTNVFTSVVSGLFSLFLVIGASKLVIAPGERRLKIAAVAAGVIVSIGLVLVAPMFRP